MPLFDLFKKSSRKEPAQENALGSPEMQKKRYDAALEFLKIFQERMPLVGGKPHAGTVLSVAARLAGTSLYRSLNYEKGIVANSVVLSDKVNEAWPQLLNQFAFYCKQNGIEVMSKPLITAFPEQDKPRMTLEQVRQEYQDQYHAIMKKHGLDDLDAARAGMIVCSVIFQYHCIRAKDIDPYMATGIIAMGVVEGVKTSPTPLRTEDSPAPVIIPAQNNQFTELLKSIAQNSIDGTGLRLVLGEGMTPLQEARRNGGRYILVHPGVTQQLEQNNMDPFLVYEAALRMEMTARIPQIEFTGVNVDTALQTWSGKPEGQAPLHIRQALWLQRNANQLGYEKTGNSWKLKQ